MTNQEALSLKPGDKVWLRHSANSQTGEEKLWKAKVLHVRQEISGDHNSVRIKVSYYDGFSNGIFYMCRPEMLTHRK